MGKRTWTDEQLKAAVLSSDSIAEVLRFLGLAVRPGNYKTINKYIKSLELNTTHFVGQNWVGTRNTVPSKRPIDEILVVNSTYNTSHLRDRLIKEGLKNWVCEMCHRRMWLGSPIALETDHINGVNNDHRLENLRFLCPNCHATTDTWRGRKPKI